MGSWTGVQFDPTGAILSSSEVGLVGVVEEGTETGGRGAVIGGGGGGDVIAGATGTATGDLSSSGHASTGADPVRPYIEAAGREAEITDGALDGAGAGGVFLNAPILTFPTGV